MDDALRAVADPTRREILRLVRDREVAVRPAGNRRLYRWRPEGLRDVAAFLDELWTDNLARLKAAAEQREWPERARAGLAPRPPADEERP
jgi:hypothetical protein